MNRKTIFAFITGVAVGAAGAWVYFNKKYFPTVDEPVEEQEDLHSKITREPKKESIPEKEEDKSDETDEAARIEYQNVTKQYTEDKKEKKGPYYITQDDFADGTMPTHVTYSYFEDGVVTDEYDDIVEDVDEALCEDFVNHFEEDLCYIRNEERYCDYEILREGCYYNEPPEED